MPYSKLAWMLVLPLLLLPLPGCGKQSTDTALIGTWKVSREAMLAKIGPISGGTRSPEEAKAAFKAYSTVTATFNPDNTFVVSMMGNPMAGTWQPNNDGSVDLTVTKVGATDVPQGKEGGGDAFQIKMSCKLNASQDRLTLRLPSGGDAPVKELILDRAENIKD